MSFLNPALWAGLFLAFLPILIHLLGRRRLKRQWFSTLEFLRRLELKNMRKMKIRQWILLLLRTLAVLLLALAFLRPTIEDRSVAGTASTDVLFLLDYSASMDAHDPQGTPVSRMKELVQVIVDAPGTGRMAMVALDADGHRDLPWQRPSDDVLRFLAEQEVDGRSQSPQEAWLRVQELAEENPLHPIQVIWLSDFRYSVPDSLRPLPQNAQLLFASVAPDQAPVNASIEHIVQETAVPISGLPMTVTVECRLDGIDRERNAILTLTLNGRRIAEGEVVLIPGGTARRTFTFQATQPGWIPGDVELVLEDALLRDNRLPFVLHIPERIRVLVAGNDSVTRHMAHLALDPEQQNSYFDVTVYHGPLNSLRFEEYDVIMLAGYAQPTAIDARRLQEFVTAGGGVWILLNHQIDPGAYNRYLLPALQLGSLYSMEQSRTPRFWESLPLQHPAFAGLLEGSGNFDIPRTFRAFHFGSNTDAQNLIRLSDGSSLLQEQSIGDGNVWMMSTSADTTWSDWGMSGIFAPMMQKGCSYLASHSATGVLFSECGEPVFWPREPESSGQLPEVINPYGNRYQPSPGFHKGEAVWIYRQTRLPGHYQLEQTGLPHAVTAVRLPVSESVLSVQLTQENLQGFWLDTSQSPADFQAQLAEQRLGHEISRWLLLAVLLLLVLERLIARDTKPQINQPEPKLSDQPV